MRRSILLFIASSGPLAIGLACGSVSESVFEEPPPGGNGEPPASFPPATPPPPATSTCENGKACGDGGVCAGNTCCEGTAACGSTCCGVGQVCSFQTCVTPGAVCRDSSECGLGNYCEFTLGTTTSLDGGAGDAGDGGACVVGVDVTGRCLPRPPECAPDAGASTGGTLTCLERCEYRPAVPSFATVQKFAWGGDVTSPYETEVMMAPIVIQLTDDDCDGKITERDIPEIVFSTFTWPGGYETNGVVHAISIVNGAFIDVWRVPNASNPTALNPTKHLAGGNFDGQPGNEIVGCGLDGTVKALRGTDGAFLWTSPPMACHMPAIADLDGDGNVEVIVEGGILNGADGTLKHAYSEPLVGNFVVSDIDGDGQLDVVTATKAYHADGTKFVDTGLGGAECTGAGAPFCANFPDDSDSKGPFVGIGDFDVDGKPEVVAVDNWTHSITVWRYDALAPEKFQIVRPAVDMNQQFTTNPCSGYGALHGGGPPTVADFDKDGFPDVGLAGGIGYVVFNGKKLVDAVNFTAAETILWSQPTTDCSSASTGSTVFDFDGDGKAEVVYSDELRMRIYDGATGNELASFCNTTATLSEFPLVADVDNDGHADIIVASNAYSRTCDEPDGGPAATRQGGIRVFGAANGTWVRTRRVWNQHSYHVTNVEEDGTIPKNELPNWKQPGLNNFRQNKQPGSEFAAPNVVVRVSPLCPGPNGVRVTVQNLGQALVPAGVVVGVYAGTPGSGVKIGSVTTTRALYPAESEVLELPLAPPAPATVYAIADDGAPPHPSWHECRTDDNTSAAVTLSCTGPN